MTPNAHRLVYWAPRALGIGFVLFLSIFALDVLGDGQSFRVTAIALLMHLVPSLFVLAVLAVAWRYEWVGAIAFPLLALAYVVMAWGRMHWSAYALVAGPPFVIGVLFLWSWRARAALRPRIGPA